ncbi:hypothetical protein [Bosea sp. 685]|uniref:hypothetical protein n=1 Tax=Bosea sp. 685 TaxID=3080057 RepID=UPI002892C8D4|nr:hypothetical protein [Bosea sp. 685]WNJ90337.1 hypothetical protein RMR04_28825 [Bosea sp. 685]
MPSFANQVAIPDELPGYTGIAVANAMILHVGRFAPCEIDGRGDALHYLPGGRV